MKTYRLIALAAAMLITVFLARFFADEETRATQDQTHAAAVAPWL
jgi:hypothetical protein